MKYIVNKSNNPAYNIALEAYAFRELTSEDEIFILWINEPAIIIGKHQNTIQEINKEYTDEHGIHVVRRLSGGGAVYHDLNNLNYTIISNKSEEGAFDFKTFSQPVIATLADLGVKAEFTGRNDLEIDGKKFCGNAQAYYKGRMMHHGCLLFDVDMSVLGDALKVSKDKIESKGIKSVRARVTNILNELPEKITVNEFSDKILEKMKETYQPNLMDIVGGMRTVSPTDGRTIAVNNQIDFDNPESIDKCKDNHATFLFMSSIQLIVESTILPALVKLNSEHQITKEMLENLCEQSPIVPPNRQKLMSQALYAGFQQDYYASTHILCPQFEHMIRVMLKDIGVKTTYIANDGIETENGLSSLMKSSEIVDLLGENLCFEIKTIFTDSHGFNLRNDIAHGLLDDEYAVTAGSVYAWHLTLRLIIKSYIGNK